MNGWKKGAGQREPVAPGTFSLFDPLQAGQVRLQLVKRTAQLCMLLQME